MGWTAEFGRCHLGGINPELDTYPLDQATDAGLCDRLSGVALPAISLPSTRGGPINLRSLTSPRTVIYCYPRTREPG